mmetsp:Transcript_9750/g.18956  ORF Transcript_9750/g.18956 Transcript_9750/m.18956 type:complete len:328 (+) Transcript_9750:164-1147(+)|eukprot:CAMPEP_0173406944 /NCGR_PEP_ID=MMETSP1356-20130122/65909_1 /TAXON_ID=77927 ORGANISM="Hemiselmis virescens, Strain PCC157" /NCGR_SAMPLE_ID=MMETSP1356 /ASSEMBLY_ACC=CAM_ASM_000847 /LENGTH=327 /DNA_ID=CAMNT_0014368029 /DNA_START=79 /DNA_END=1062 /DNA_ORIENTATION=+
METKRYEKCQATTADGLVLNFWRFCSPTPPQHSHPVMLLHGLASNNQTYDLQSDVSVADFFVAEGYDTFLVELRGSGGNKDARTCDCACNMRWCFDDHIQDCRAFLGEIFRMTGKPVHFVGHSMGAMLLQCIAGSEDAKYIRSGTSIGGSLFMEDSGWKSYLILWPVAKYLPLIHANWFQTAISPLSFRCNTFWDKFFFCQANVDTATARLMFKKNWEPMSTALLGQMRSAFDPAGLKSKNGDTCYADSLDSIRVPMLVVAGSKDKQMPPSGLEKLASRIPDCKYVVLGAEHGQEHDYGHFDLIVGRNARQDVWNRVASFLLENDSG